MNQAQAISQYQPMLQAIAFSILRCKADAEDIVQETFLKWLGAEQKKIKNTKAYLVKAVKNNCLTHLNTLRKRKEEYLDSIQVPEIFLKLKETNLSHLDLDFDLSAAFKVLQSKLEPLERAVYVLKEVFDFDYEEVQNTLNKKKEHCRQLFCRAKKKLNATRSEMNFDLIASSNLLQSFRASCDLGNATEFIHELKKTFLRLSEKIFKNTFIILSQITSLLVYEFSQVVLV